MRLDQLTPQETVVELDEGATAVGSDEAAPTTPATTLPIAGSAAELLPEMADEMSRLSGQIAEEGDEARGSARSVANVDVKAVLDHAAKLMKAVARCEGDKDAVKKVGVQYATSQCADLLDNGVAGIHFYTLNRSDATRQIYQTLGAKDSAALRDDAAPPPHIVFFLVDTARSRANIDLFEQHIAIDLITGRRIGQADNRCRPQCTIRGS